MTIKIHEQSSLKKCLSWDFRPQAVFEVYQSLINSAELHMHFLHRVLFNRSPSSVFCLLIRNWLFFHNGVWNSRGFVFRQQMTLFKFTVFFHVGSYGLLFLCQKAGSMIFLCEGIKMMSYEITVVQFEHHNPVSLEYNSCFSHLSMQ